MNSNRTLTICVAVLLLLAGASLIIIFIRKGTSVPTAGPNTQRLIGELPLPSDGQSQKPITVSSATSTPFQQTDWPTGFSPTSTWPTYRNETLGVLFKYPPELSVGIVPTGDGSFVVGVGIDVYHSQLLKDVVDISRGTPSLIGQEESPTVTASGLVEYKVVAGTSTPVLYTVQCPDGQLVIQGNINYIPQITSAEKPEYYDMLDYVIDSLQCHV